MQEMVKTNYLVGLFMLFQYTTVDRVLISFIACLSKQVNMIFNDFVVATNRFLQMLVKL